MVDNSLVILRSSNFKRISGPKVFGFDTRNTRLTGNRPSDIDLVIDVKENDPRVYEEAMNDDTVHAVAPGMPLKLLAPIRKSATAAAALVAANASGVAWGIKAVGADSSQFTGVEATVAILDTGIDIDHPAFKNRGIDITSKDFTRTGSEDRDGHGTHCAGTIFGRDVNGVRIGVAPGVKRALVAKVLGGQAGTEALLAAFSWALAEGAIVISMSLGYDFTAYCEYWEERGTPKVAAISKALTAYRENIRLFDRYIALSTVGNGNSKGAIVVAATGNESEREAATPYTIDAASPSAAEDVISVAALGSLRNKFFVAPFSNTNPSLSAPGVDVVSAEMGGKLVAMSGTSMACPHVAGLAALYLDAHKGQDLAIIRSKLIASTHMVGFPSGSAVVDVGAGIPKAPS